MNWPITHVTVRRGTLFASMKRGKVPFKFKKVYTVSRPKPNEQAAGSQQLALTVFQSRFFKKSVFFVLLCVKSDSQLTRPASQAGEQISLIVFRDTSEAVDCSLCKL